MLRFLHAADFHLDSPFTSLAPRQAQAAREGQRDLMQRFVDLAREREVDLVFIAGDLFDSRNVYPETIDLLQQVFASCPAEIFISPGNHDPYTRQSPYAKRSWPKNVHIFEKEHVQNFPLPQLGCTIYGAGYTEMSYSGSPLDALELTEEGLHIGVFHADTSRRKSRYGPLRTEEIAASGLHYLALGHIHQRSELTRAGGTYYAYPGTPQGRGFDEQGEKGVYYGTLSEEGEASLEFIPMAHREYRSISVDVTGQTAREALGAVLPQGGTPHIARIFFSGIRCEAQLPFDKLEEHASPFYYSVAIFDETQSPRGLWDRLNEDGLCGLFLRRMQKDYQAAVEEEEKEKILLAVRFGLAALEGREEPKL